MRFLADENVSKLVVDRLRASSFEVISIREIRSGAQDKNVLEAANSEDCILITEDRDFGELLIRQQLQVRGMILLELDRLSSSAEADLVAEIVAAHREKLFGNPIVIEPARIRVRPLSR